MGRLAALLILLHQQGHTGRVLLEEGGFVPLADPAKVAIHSVVDRDAVWDVVPQLKAAGASGILVLPIEQLLL